MQQQTTAVLVLQVMRNVHLLGSDPSKVVIPKLKLDKDRKSLLERRRLGRTEKEKGEE